MTIIQRLTEQLINVADELKKYIESLEKEIQERSEYIQEYGIDMSDRSIIRYSTLNDRAQEDIENLKHILEIAERVPDEKD